MGQPSYPPPPPSPQPAPSPGAIQQGEFHLPRTNLFKSIRNQLSALEKPTDFTNMTELLMGFILALVLSGFLVTLTAYGINTAILSALGQAAWILIVIIAPIIEETAKAAVMIAVALFCVKIFPNRRYGAAIGAATGLGYGAMESILYIATGLAPDIGAFIRWLFTPIMHPLWSAFVGIGIFVFAAKRAQGKGLGESLIGLPLIFWIFGILNHALWNALAVLLPNAGGIWLTPYLPVVLDAIIIFPLFAFLLRDFLGGHFNFQHFFEPLAEPSPYYPTVAPPPPPVQTVPTCPTCGQPLAFIQEYNRWYCPREKKYV